MAFFTHILPKLGHFIKHPGKTTISMNTPWLDIRPNFATVAKFEVLSNSLRIHLEILNLLWQSFMLLGKIFIVVCGQILNNLAILSHCFRYIGLLCCRLKMMISNFRFLGEPRFTLWAVVRVVNLRHYRGRLHYKPGKPRLTLLLAIHFKMSLFHPSSQGLGMEQYHCIDDLLFILFMLNWQQIYLFGRIQTSQTEGQP